MVGCSPAGRIADGSEVLPGLEPAVVAALGPGGCAAAPSSPRFCARYEFSSLRSSATWPGWPAAFAWSAASNFFSALAAASGLVGRAGAGGVRSTKTITMINPAKLVHVRIWYAFLNRPNSGTAHLRY